MSLFPAIWDKHANPHHALGKIGNIPLVPLRVWQIKGEIANMINERQEDAFQAAEKLNRLSARLGVSLAFLAGYHSYVFFSDCLEEDDMRAPEGFTVHSRSDGIYYLESNDQEVQRELKQCNDTIGKWLGVQLDIARVASKMRGDLDNLGQCTTEFFDRLKSTSDTLRLVQFQADYYITTAGDGLDMPGCTEIHYADYLRMMANHAASHLPGPTIGMPR